ncbi:MAG: META domain-containing protein [Hahellaceae bacterium]|nr:META domain-containing protein [Hahellaceae bacterium]
MQLRGKTVKSVGWGLWISLCLMTTTVWAESAGDLLPKALKGEWMATSIDSLPVMEHSPTSFQLKDGKVTGNAACNRYFGSFELNDDQLVFDQLASTQTYCADALMDQELRFLQTMERVAAWRIENGVLLLLDGNDEVILKLARSGAK